MARDQSTMRLEIEELLQPIAENQVCGEDLSFSNEFHAIKKAKAQDDPLLDLGDWVSEPKQADWIFVADTASQLLTTRTKDIRLLTWTSEAWANLHGYAGIADSLALAHRMLKQYWFEMHPEIDDGDLDQRLGLLQGLVNQLPQLIKKVPIINQAPYYSLFDYESFLHQQNNRLKHSDDAENNATSVQLEQFDQAILNTSKSFQFQNYNDFSDILVQWAELKRVLDELMQLDAPSFAHIDSSIEDLHKSLRKIYKTDTFAPASNAQVNVEQAQTEHNTQQFPTESAHTMTIPSQPTFQPAPQSHLQNREQAMQVLQQIADYFQTNEPHSPVSYMLQKTIKWSQMPLHEWLLHVIKNDNPLESVQELLGVQKNNPESNDW